MAKKRRSPVIGSSAVTSSKCLKRGKAKAVPAFEPIIRTRGQAQKELDIRLINNKISEFQGPKKSVERRREAGSTYASPKASNVKKPHSHNTRHSKKVVPPPATVERNVTKIQTDTEERNVTKIQDALIGSSDAIEPSAMQKKDDKVDDTKGVPDTVNNSSELMAATKDEDFNKDVGTEVSKDDIVGVPNTVDSSELIAAKKEQVSKKDVETEAPAFQKVKDDAVDTRPSNGVPRSFDMDHHCSAVTLDNDDPSLYIDLKGAYYQFHDVPGDGKGLFHALAKIPALPFSSAQEVRNAVVSYVLHGRAGDYRLKPTAARTLRSCTRSFYKEDVECWAKRMKQCGTERKHWGTTWEATIVAYMCGIEIIVLTNLHSGFEKVSSKETLRMHKGEALQDFFPAEYGTFYLLHHRCGFPGEPSDPSQFNHYAFLQSVASMPTDANIIYDSGQNNKPDFYNLCTVKKEGQRYDESGKKEDLTNPLTSPQSTLFTPPMAAQDDGRGHFSPRFTGTVSEQLLRTTSSHKGLKKKTVRVKATPRKHSTSSYNNDLTPSKIKLLIDRPTELAEAFALAETIAAVHVSLATASDRLNYLLQSKNQNSVNLHSTSQDKSPEHVEVCGNEAKMATPGYIGCAEATVLKSKRVDRMEEVGIRLKRKKYQEGEIKRVEPSKRNPIDESLKEAVASLFPTTAKKVSSPKKAKAAKTALRTHQKSKDKSTTKPKANHSGKGRANTRRAPRRITAIKSQGNRRALKRVAQAYGGAQRLTDARRKKPKNIILTQNEASAKRIRESFQFSEDSEKYEYVVCHNAEELLDAISDKDKASQHTIKGVFKPGILNVALQNPSGAQLFTPPVSVPI